MVQYNESSHILHRRVLIGSGVGLLFLIGSLAGLFVTGSFGGGKAGDSVNPNETYKPLQVSTTLAPSLQPTKNPSPNPTSRPTHLPTPMPSHSPTPKPTINPTQVPTIEQTTQPTTKPTSTPTSTPTTKSPSKQPTLMPLTNQSNINSTVLSVNETTNAPSTKSPSFAPTVQISPSPTAQLDLSPTNGPTETEPLYRPGFLTVNMHGLVLSEGLSAKMIAVTDRRPTYANGNKSSTKFHIRPDFGATFVDTRTNNPGGWIYVSNSEVNITSEGGVGALTFNANGQLIDYKMVLTDSTMNCGGGRTPWNTWVSCEEVKLKGNIYQVDPTGARVAEKTSIGQGFGRFESFSYDVRNKTQPRFYASEDRKRGAVRRFTPNDIDWETDPWNMLHGDGTLEFLLMTPDTDSSEGGNFTWTTDESAARDSAQSYYPECEGIDVNDGTMYLIAKRIKTMFVLDLDAGTYQNYSTVHGIFDGQPDQVSRILNDGDSDILYFTEEGGENAGIHGRNSLGQFFTILEGPGYFDETTGLSFSPDGKHMYFAFQVNGVMFDVTRDDGLPFQGKTLNVKYHNVALGEN